jgi:hypothetical protein
MELAPFLLDRIMGLLMAISYRYAMYFNQTYSLPPSFAPPRPDGLPIVPLLPSCLWVFINNLASTPEQKHMIFVFLRLAYVT